MPTSLSEKNQTTFGELINEIVDEDGNSPWILCLMGPEKMSLVTSMFKAVRSECRDILDIPFNEEDGSYVFGPLEEILIEIGSNESFTGTKIDELTPKIATAVSSMRERVKQAQASSEFTHLPMN